MKNSVPNSLSVARRLATATPTITQNAHCEPAVKACGNFRPAFISWLKWLIETDEATATPIAPPICCAVLIRPEASPASCGSVPVRASRTR